MDDKQILDLYWARSENAIQETADKYGRYCHFIAFHILNYVEDSEECVNDTYLRAWKTIPPKRPERLSVFLGKLTRNLSLDRYRRNTAAKRGFGQVALALEELKQCVPAPNSVEQVIDNLTLQEILNRFLGALPAKTRKIFMRRYWYFCSVKEIAEDLNVSESRVKMTLMRARKELRTLLEEEGIML